jgi:hypothetical protein
MATLGTKTFTQLLQDWAAAAQGACATLLDFAVGAILRAISEAQGGVGLWLQASILQLLTTTRLATSTKSDVDSFVADFGLTRLPAVAAVGQVTFARYTPTNAAVIPVGALIQTADGTQTFAVIADPTQPAYSALQNAYLIAANVSSVYATVQAQNGGTQGNISAGTLTVLQSGISGVDTVTNASAFTTGVNAETDAALKARFVAYLASLSKGTTAAIGSAITGLNQNLQYTITLQPTSTPNVLVTVDDGSGAISNTLVAAALAAVSSVIAAGISVGVSGATKLGANVNMTIVTANGYTHSTVVGQVAITLAAYINGLGLGNSVGPANPCSYGQLFAVAFSVPGVIDVTNVTLNGGTADLVPTAFQTVKAGAIAVS